MFNICIEKRNKIENKYCNLFCLNNGAPAKPIRLALGALLIQSMEGIPDERLVLHIQENPHMQYFCDIKECSWELPFVPSLMVDFESSVR